VLVHGGVGRQLDAGKKKRTIEMRQERKIKKKFKRQNKKKKRKKKE